MRTLAKRGVPASPSSLRSFLASFLASFRVSFLASFRAVGALAVGTVAVGCGGPEAKAPSSLASVDAARSTPAAQDAASVAPQAYARAEAFRREAQAAAARGDGASADLLAARALTGYERARVLARRSRAEKELDAATAEASQMRESLRATTAARQEAEKDAEELERRLRLVREGRTLAVSGPATPEREAARLVAARSLATQGVELCGAARLLAPSDPGLAASESEANKLVAQLQSVPKTVPIDAAARARATCLAALTRARRAGAVDVLGEADALLAELSAAGGWAPFRDERGVVVTLRGVGKGAMAPEAATKLKELAQVAASHPRVSVQVVAHESRPEPPDASIKKAEAAARVLLDAGVAKERVQWMSSGNRRPVVDPQDAKLRDRNERIELVFVTRTP